MAGAKLPDQPLDGVDLTPAFVGNALKRDALFWHLPNYTGNITTNARVWQAPASAIRVGDWKLIEHLDQAKVELYHLARDPGEAHDLAAVEPARVAELTARLHAWRKSTGAPVPTETNSKYDPALLPPVETLNRRIPGESKKLTRIAP
jgi:arylsulfatase A-like enzyme